LLYLYVTTILINYSEWMRVHIDTYSNVVTTRRVRSADQRATDQRAQSCGSGFIESGSGYGPRITSESGCGSVSRVLMTNKTEEKKYSRKRKKYNRKF
jgi:hypothetical protein